LLREQGDDLDIFDKGGDAWSGSNAAHSGYPGFSRPVSQPNPGLSELDFSEAAIGDLTQSATWLPVPIAEITRQKLPAKLKLLY
jgi:hypothetical protein